MIVISNSNLLWQVNEPGVELYVSAGVTKPIPFRLTEGDKVKVLEKQWDWVCVVPVSGSGAKGWLKISKLKPCAVA